MAEAKAKILVVDDHKLARETLGDLIERRFNYQVCSPASLHQLKEVLTFEIFDSLLIDVDLDAWEVPGNIDGARIEDGTDVARFYFDLHKIKSGRLYSTHVQYPGPRFDRKIKRLQQKIEETPFDFTPLPKSAWLDMKQIEENFRPAFEAAEAVYRANLLLRPASYYRDKHLPKLLRAYGRVCSLHSKWLDFNFQSVGDCSWAVLCGRRAERSYYGKPLNGNGGRRGEFPVEIREHYPSEDELGRLARERDAFAFVVWNTRRTEFLAKQFERAGPRLANIPEHLQDFFGIAAAAACTRAYEEGLRAEVIRWCRQLTVSAQVEVTRQIYKRLYGTPALEEFVGLCRSANLPVIVEVYEARVDQIEEEGEPVAWVELRNLGGYMAVSMEPFDLNLLRGAGVDHESQRFEYTVYRLPNGHVAMSIDPVEALG